MRRRFLFGALAALVAAPAAATAAPARAASARAASAQAAYDRQRMEQILALARRVQASGGIGGSVTSNSPASMSLAAA